MGNFHFIFLDMPPWWPILLFVPGHLLVADFSNLVWEPPGGRFGHQFGASPLVAYLRNWFWEHPLVADFVHGAPPVAEVRNLAWVRLLMVNSGIKFGRVPWWPL